MWRPRVKSKTPLQFCERYGVMTISYNSGIWCHINCRLCIQSAFHLVTTLVLVVFKYTNFLVCFFMHFLCTYWVLNSKLVLIDTQWFMNNFVHNGHNDELLRPSPVSAFQIFTCLQFKLAIMPSLPTLISHQGQFMFEPWHDIICWGLQPLLELLPLLYYIKMFSPPPIRHCQTLLLIYNHSTVQDLICICTFLFPSAVNISIGMMTLFLRRCLHSSSFSHWVKNISLTRKNRPWAWGMASTGPFWTSSPLKSGTSVQSLLVTSSVGTKDLTRPTNHTHIFEWSCFFI